MAEKRRLDASLSRSAQLGREVLLRAQRRAIDWTSARPAHRPDMVYSADKVSEDSLRVSVDKAFAAIVELMADTSRQCRSFYRLWGGGAPSQWEQKHICGFHSKQPGGAPGEPQPRGAGRPSTRSDPVPSHPEDFLVIVPPGTYAITAGMQEADPQTQVVRVGAGETMTLTFNL